MDSHTHMHTSSSCR